MLVLLPTIVALFGAAVLATIAIRSRKSARSLLGVTVVPAAAAVETRTLVHAVRRRMLLATVVGVAFGIGVAFLPLDHVQSASAVAPAAGGVAGLLVIALSPFPRRASEHGIRRADLTPRGTFSFGPRWGFILPIIVVGVLTILLIATGATANLDDDGRMRAIAIAVPQHIQLGAPYPGWFYGVPILVAIACVILTLLTTLNRICIAPRIGSSDVAPLDLMLRATLTRYVMLFSTAVIVLYLGGITLAAGRAVRYASAWAHLTVAFQKFLYEKSKAEGRRGFSFTTTAHDQVHGVVQPSYTEGAIGSIVGIVLIGAAIVLALLALSNLVIRWSAIATADRESIDA